MNKFAKFFGLAFMVMLFCFAGAFPGLSHAEDISLKFTWEQDIPADMAGWRLYMNVGASGGGDLANYTLFATIPYTGTTQTTYTTTNFLTVPSGSTNEYFFVLTAFDVDGYESSASNEVSQVIDVAAPGAPFSLTVDIVQGN